MARLEADGETQWWEQLWSRQLADDRFELCCIPFYAYNLALGDVVETDATGEHRYVIQRVVQPSGHFTFRVWFGDSSHPTVRDEVLGEINRLGCLFEWFSPNLLAISAGSEDTAQRIADYLWSREQEGHLVYETGRT
jgi:hypothetical protein